MSDGTDPVKEKGGKELDHAELQMMVNIMQPYEITVDKCRDYFIFISMAENLEEQGGDPGQLTFESREFLETKERLKRNKKMWKELREMARKLLGEIKKLNRMAVPDIFKALNAGDEGIRAVISARLILRRLDGALIDLPEDRPMGVDGQAEIP